MSLVVSIKMSISFHDFFLSPSLEFKDYKKYFFIKTPIDLEKC